MCTTWKTVSSWIYLFWKAIAKKSRMEWKVQLYLFCFHCLHRCENNFKSQMSKLMGGKVFRDRQVSVQFDILVLRNNDGKLATNRQRTGRSCCCRAALIRLRKFCLFLLMGNTNKTRRIDYLRLFHLWKSKLKIYMYVHISILECIIASCQKL